MRSVVSYEQLAIGSIAHSDEAYELMKPFRLTISTMMLGIGVLAVGFAALRYPTRLGASVLFSLTSIILVVSTIRAVIRRDAGSIGFAIAGGAYMAIHFCIWPWITSLAGSRGETGSPPLVTTALLDVAYPMVVPAAYRKDGAFMMTITSESITGPPASLSQYLLTKWTDIDRRPSNTLGLTSPRSYQDSGHCVFALLAGCLGSFVGRSFARRASLHEKDA